MFHGKHLARARKTRLHLIRYQHNAMLIAQVSQPLHSGLLNDVKPTLTLHRLKDNCCNPGRLDIALKQLLHCMLGLVQ